MVRRLMIAVVAAAAALASAPSAFAFGALAIDDNHGTRQGIAVNEISPEAARANALAKCGDGCRVVVTFESTCAAFAADQTPGSPIASWGYALAAPRAEAFALGRCERQGGMDCSVRVMACEGRRLVRGFARGEPGVPGAAPALELAVPEPSTVLSPLLRLTPPAEVPAAAAPRVPGSVPATPQARVETPTALPPPAAAPTAPAAPPATVATAPPPPPVASTPAPASAPAVAGRRIAIVIGNDRYEHLPVLQKAVNDARAVGAALVKVGFEVIRVENATRRVMNQKLAELTGKIERGDTVFFFFAGHGVEIKSANYLLPVDTPAAREGQESLITAEGIPADNVIERLQEAGAKISLLVLDACRDNPFKKAGSRGVGGSRGLAPINGPRGVFVLYSAGYGEAALDRLSDSDPNPNSVFTRSLVPVLAKSGITVQEIAKLTQAEVNRLAATVNHSQMPAYYDQILGQFSLVPAK
jgi:hypothetical protein